MVRRPKRSQAERAGGGVKHVGTISPATVSRKTTPTGDARWRVNWKDGISRNIRFTPLDGIQARGWANVIYRSKSFEKTVQAQARPLHPDEVDRKLSRESERDVPLACTNRQHQDLALMTAEPCRCNPEQAQRCAEQLAIVAHQEEMVWHDSQVAWMQEAASYLLEDNPTGLPWKITFTPAEDPVMLKQLVAANLVATSIAEQNDLRARKVALSRERWRERRFRTPYTWLLSESDIGAAFVAMLYVADDLDLEFWRQNNRTVDLYCNASTLSARAYQAATAVLTAYYDHNLIGVAEHDILAARIVTEVFDSCLPPRHIKQSPNPVGDYFVVTRMLDRSEDLSVSSYTIAKLYGLDASTIRARFNRKLEDIEGQVGKYCSGYNALAYYPQSASRPVYNIISVGMPIAERLTEPRLRDIQQPYSPESKSELAVMQVLAWAQGHCRKQLGRVPQQLPPGSACHYAGTAEVRSEREYPSQPYGTKPLQIWLPQPAHSFKYEVPTTLPATLGLPFDNNFFR
jgi:hypothetical protein